MRPASPQPLLAARQGDAAASAEGGAITQAEREAFLKVRNAFIARQCERALNSTRTNVLAAGETIDLIASDWVAAIAGGQAATNRRLYLFRPIVDRDLAEWMRSTVWTKEWGAVAIITIVASEQALATCGRRLSDRGQVGVFALRDGSRGRKLGTRLITHSFEQWYKKWGRQTGFAWPSR
jgi:hypothetical protein